MTTGVMSEMEAIARRLKREMAEYEPYEFGQDGPWNDTLRRLELTHKGRTSLLWRRFLQYEAARKAHEAGYEQRRRWQQQLAQVRRQVHEVETEGDPDTIDYDALVRAKAKAEVLDKRVSDPHGVLGELKTVLQRANERWGTQWQSYTTLKTEERRQERSTAFGAEQELRRIRTDLERLEAPRGD